MEDIVHMSHQSFSQSNTVLGQTHTYVSQPIYKLTPVVSRLLKVIFRRPSAHSYRNPIRHPVLEKIIGGDIGDRPCAQAEYWAPKGSNSLNEGEVRKGRSRRKILWGTTSRLVVSVLITFRGWTR